MEYQKSDNSPRVFVMRETSYWLSIVILNDFDIESVAQASNSVANFESPDDTTHRDGLEPKGEDEEKS